MGVRVQRRWVRRLGTEELSNRRRQPEAVFSAWLPAVRVYTSIVLLSSYLSGGTVREHISGITYLMQEGCTSRFRRPPSKQNAGSALERMEAPDSISTVASHVPYPSPSLYI